MDQLLRRKYLELLSFCNIYPHKNSPYYYFTNKLKTELSKNTLPMMIIVDDSNYKATINDKFISVIKETIDSLLVTDSASISIRKVLEVIEDYGINIDTFNLICYISNYFNLSGNYEGNELHISKKTSSLKLVLDTPKKITYSDIKTIASEQGYENDYDVAIKLAALCCKFVIQREIPTKEQIEKKLAQMIRDHVSKASFDPHKLSDLANAMIDNDSKYIDPVTAAENYVDNKIKTVYNAITLKKSDLKDLDITLVIMLFANTRIESVRIILED